jgi:uncharacterized phage infection (PIP) family protein YhgE
MSAMEDFQSSEFASIDDLNAGAEQVKEAFNEYADECESALDAWENGNSQLEERADGARTAADELDSWEPEEFDYQGEVKDDGEPVDQAEYDDALAEHVSEQQNEFEEAMGSAEGNWI